MEPRRCLPHIHFRPPSVLLTAFLVGALLCGCSSGGKLVQVTGTVKLNGQPVEGAVVIFWPLDESTEPSKRGYGRAISDASGKFVVKDLYGKDGLFTGDYKVTFNRYIDSKGNLIDSGSKPNEVIGARDSMPKASQAFETTLERARVTDDGLDIVFDLRSK